MKHYYAAHSYMGLNYTYDSPCWMVYCFDSKADRDRWLKDNEYNDNGNLVAEAVTFAEACKIAPDLRRELPEYADRVTYLVPATGGFAWAEQSKQKGYYRSRR